MHIKAVMLSANSSFKDILNKTHKQNKKFWCINSCRAREVQLTEKSFTCWRQKKQKLMKFRVQNTSIFLLFSKQSSNRSVKRIKKKKVKILRQVRNIPIQ